MAVTSLAELVRDETTRIGRALALLDDHGHEIERVERGVYLVPSSGGGDPYFVEYGGPEESCSCKDFEFHGHETPCKHLLALGILGAKKRREFKCDGCGAPTPRRELVEVHPEHESFSAYFEGERLCRASCAKHAGVL